MSYKFNPITGNLDLVGGGDSSKHYAFQNYEKTSTYVYVGYEGDGGIWYIYRRTIATNAREYATGATDYATNWTGRAGLTYV